MGLEASERVIEVIRHPRQNGSLIYTNQGRIAIKYIESRGERLKKK